MNLNLYLKEKRQSVDEFLRKYIASKKKLKDCPEQLREAMGYSLMAGGKRVRPILAIAGYEAVGGGRTISSLSQLQLSLYIHIH